MPFFEANPLRELPREWVGIEYEVTQRIEVEKTVLTVRNFETRALLMEPEHYQKAALEFKSLEEVWRTHSNPSGEIHAGVKTFNMRYQGQVRRPFLNITLATLVVGHKKLLEHKLGGVPFVKAERASPTMTAAYNTEQDQEGPE